MFALLYNISINNTIGIDTRLNMYNFIKTANAMQCTGYNVNQIRDRFKENETANLIQMPSHAN